MLWTLKTEKALYKAALLHDGQYRKGENNLPFIVHPIVVSGIVSQHTDDEDVVTAALLHDTLEDTKYTKDEMESEFGEKVASIVLGVTIPEAYEGDEHSSWTDDRTRYIENLRGASNESAIVAAADKIHNFRSVLENYSDDKEKFKKDFGGNAKDRIHVYGSIVELVASRVPKKLAEELEEAWVQYKKFIDDVGRGS